VPVCGRIVEYNFSEPEIVPRNLRFFIPKRVRMQGLPVYDFYHRWLKGLARLAEWIKTGALKYKEDKVEGIENMSAVFLKLFQGKNFGKLLVKAGKDTTA